MGTTLIVIAVAAAITFRLALLASVIGWLPERLRDWFFGEYHRHA
jgi:hypothetical protein